MQYKLVDMTPDFGFTFYEKLHEPIFLVHKTGKIRKLNEAGRKLLSIGKIDILEIEKSLLAEFQKHIRSSSGSTFKIHLFNLGLRLIARDLKNSDHFLIEVKRCSKANELSAKERGTTKISTTE